MGGCPYTKPFYIRDLSIHGFLCWGWGRGILDQFLYGYCVHNCFNILIVVFKVIISFVIPCIFLVAFKNATLRRHSQALWDGWGFLGIGLRTLLQSAFGSSDNRPGTSPGTFPADAGWCCSPRGRGPPLWLHFYRLFCIYETSEPSVQAGLLLKAVGFSLG